MTEAQAIVGVGMSSAATRDEIASLLGDELARAGAGSLPVRIATRAAFLDDPRLQLGYPVVGIEDDVLVEHSEPVERAVGIPARVAETAALLAVGRRCHQLEPTRRSAHATVAVAIVSATDTNRRDDRDVGSVRSA